MATPWTITFDCTEPARMAEFWGIALGYVEEPPPTGFASWDQWLADMGVPPEEWEDGASVCDPDGVGPRMSFLKVPEPKQAKNRMHIDIQAGGGRATPLEVRWPRVTAAVERLVTVGAVVIAQSDLDGHPDHMVMADPEGNEFCVV